jgi:hypothetical protein
MEPVLAGNQHYFLDTGTRSFVFLDCLLKLLAQPLVDPLIDALTYRVSLATPGLAEESLDVVVQLHLHLHIVYALSLQKIRQTRFDC